MTSERSGGAVVRNGRVYARVRFGKKDRLEVRVPWATTREQGADRAKVIAELCDQLVRAGRRDLVKNMAREAAQVTTDGGLRALRQAVSNYAKAGVTRIARSDAYTTFKDVAEAWVTGELRKKHPDYVQAKADFRLERARLRDYIYKHVGDVPVDAFEKRHGDVVMANLPPKIVKAPSTRRAIAQIVHRVLALAVHPLGLITSNPLPTGWLPRIERQRHYTCLYPREEAKLLACKDVAEADRLFWGILDREGMRVSELVDSEWFQWNLEEGTFTRAKNKTNETGFWALQPDVVRAMRLWKERRGAELARPFIEVAANENEKPYIATRLRDALKHAGVLRRELFVRTEHTGELRAHDLRATFVTVSIAQGRSEAWIRDRTGHRTTSMIDRYRRAARQFEELKLGPLCDLCEGLGWVITRVMATGSDGGTGSEVLVNTKGSGAGIRTPIRGSKSPVAVVNEVPSAANDGESAFEEPPSPRDVTQGSPTLQRLPVDVQDFVADCLSEAFPHAFRGDEVAVLKPLARAAKAINRGRAPKSARGGGSK